MKIPIRRRLNWDSVPESVPRKFRNHRFRNITRSPRIPGRIMMSARSTLLAVTLAVSVTAGAFIVTSVPTVAAAAPTWTAAFRDDFSGSGLPNPADWQLTLGTSYPGGPASFGTGEIETLTNNPANVNVRNGRLVITPQRDSAGAWTSARVETRRANFKPPAGGVMHVESRVQMPNVTGAQAMGYWPAFWMLGSPYRADRWSWPGIGEFDIMENVQGLNWSYNVLHCGIAGTWGGPCNEPEGINNGGAACHLTTCQAAFHTYAIEWDRTGAADQLRWYIDGALTFTVNQNQVPAHIWSSLSDHAGYFIIVNVAIGGAFPNKLGGGPTAATKPGVPMLVDYVEVKYAGGQVTPPPTPTSTKPTSRTTTSTTSTTSSTTSSTTTTVPSTGVPSNLRVTATADSTITLGWNGTAGATYDVLRSGVRIATVTATTFSTITLGWAGPANASYQVLRSGIQIATVTGRAFTDQGLFKNTPYIYSIRGNGVATPQITATIS